MAQDLKERIAFTLGALLVWRLGVYVPVPGIDPELWAGILRSQPGNIWQQFNFLSGGLIGFLGIFSLGIMPYVTAALLIQLLTLVSPALKRLKQKGERGREIITRYTLAATVFLAAMQAYGIALALEGAGSVSEPGLLFHVSTVLTLTGGTIFLVWLSREITVRGVGNGIALLLVAGVVLELPRDFASLPQAGLDNTLSGGEMFALALIVIVVTGFVVWVERARRRLMIEFPARQVGNRMLGGQSSPLCLKLNSAGIVPVVFGSWLLHMVGTVGTLIGGEDGGPPAGLMANLLHGPLHLMVFAILILFVTFLYTAFVCDPAEISEKLERHGGLIPGVAPGEATAAHVDDVVSRITLMGAAYLALVALLPEILLAFRPAAIVFDGTALLIVVCTTLDIEGQIRGPSPRSLGSPPSRQDAGG
jgi:preprotein translocase subunit SecY